MIGGTPFLFGIIAHPRPLLFSREGEDHRVQVKDQARSWIGQGEQLRPELSMQARDLPAGSGRKAAQEATQGGLVGKLLQSDPRNEQSVVLKDLGFVHAWESSDENIQKYQDQISRMIIGPIWSIPENTLQPAAQAQFVPKALDQKQTAEVGEAVRLERKIQCLQPFAHCAVNKKRVFGLAPQTVQNGRFVARGKNATFCPANKAFDEILRAVGAFFRLKRWLFSLWPGDAPPDFGLRISDFPRKLSGFGFRGFGFRISCSAHGGQLTC
jgi:hypothetical protein